MCRKRDNEGTLHYMCRYLAEHRDVVMTFIGFAAALGVYMDLRTFVDAQTQATLQVAQQLVEINLRLDQLEEQQRQK